MDKHRGELLGIQRAGITLANASVVLGIEGGAVDGSLIHRLYSSRGEVRILDARHRTETCHCNPRRRPITRPGTITVPGMRGFDTSSEPEALRALHRSIPFGSVRTRA
jgi:hypothetical protein